MRKYEVVFIVHPEQDENAFNSIIEKVRTWITDNGGSIDKADIWGRRKLAYLIRKQREGQYVLLNVSMPTSAVAGLQQFLRFQETILRHLITVVD